MTEDDGGVGHDELLAQLKVLASQFDPVPPRVREAARASATWRTIDAELAELVYDSVVDDELVGIRGSGAVRQLTFEAPGDSVEVEVTAVDRRLQGQIMPAREVEVEIRHPGGTTTVRSDSSGHFDADRLPKGPVSLRWPGGGSAGGGSTATAWVIL